MGISELQKWDLEFQKTGISLEEYVMQKYKDVKVNDVYPLPRRAVRICLKQDKFWVRPIRVEGSKITAIVLSLNVDKFPWGEKIQFDSSSIIEISGKRKAEVVEIKKRFVK